jgi:hypothetical protein
VRNPFSRKPAADARVPLPCPCLACVARNGPAAADPRAAPGAADDAAARSPAAPRITRRGLIGSAGWLAAPWALSAVDVVRLA